MPTFSASDVLEAFIHRSAKDASHVTLAERSTPQGYVRVYGPSADPANTSTSHVIVGVLNGAVSVTEELMPHLPVRDRPNPPQPIAKDPAGFSSGPNYGRYRWTLVTEDIGSPEELVRRVLDAFRKAQIDW